MAIVKRTSKVDTTKPGVQRGVVSNHARIALPNVSLSTVANVPDGSFDNHCLWVHALPGTGKTTFTAEFEGVYQFMFEPGAVFLPTFQSPVNHWLEWVAYIDAFEKSKFKWATVDLIEDAYDRCFEFMTKEVLKIEHPNDEKDFGASWGKIYTEFVRQMTRLQRIPGKGAIFVSNSTERLFKPAYGEAFEMLRPPIPSRPLERLMAKVDVMAYIYFDPATKKNWMQIRPDGFAQAKCRPTDNFLFADGNQIDRFPLGVTAKESYLSYRKAFENKIPKSAVEVKVEKKQLAKLKL